MSEKTKILLVDDNAQYLRIMSATLTSLGFVVASTANPLDAPALARQFQPDVIFVVHVMLYDLHFALRSEPAFKNTPIFIATTAMMDPAPGNKSMPVNWHFCPVPVQRDWLTAAIQEAVATARARQPESPGAGEVGNP